MKMWECGGCNGDETHKCVARVTHLVSWWRLDGCMLCCSLHVARVSWLLYHWPRFAIIRTHLTVIEAIRQNMNLVVELACAFQQQTSCIAITVLTHYFILAMPLIIAEVKWDNVFERMHAMAMYRIESDRIKSPRIAQKWLSSQFIAISRDLMLATEFWSTAHINMAWLCPLFWFEWCDAMNLAYSYTFGHFPLKLAAYVMSSRTINIEHSWRVRRRFIVYKRCISTHYLRIVLKPSTASTHHNFFHLLFDRTSLRYDYLRFVYSASIIIYSLRLRFNFSYVKSSSRVFAA